MRPFGSNTVSLAEPIECETTRKGPRPKTGPESLSPNFAQSFLQPSSNLIWIGRLLLTANRDPFHDAWSTVKPWCWLS